MIGKNSGAIILAGGKGQRLGKDKSRIKIYNETILARIASLLGELQFKETIIVYGAERKVSGLPVKEVTDLIPEHGSLGGIYTGLTYSSAEINFVMACDMPFPQLPLVSHLIHLAESGSDDCIIPEQQGHLEPLFAVYRKTCLPAIKINIEQGQLKIARILSSPFWLSFASK